MTINGQQFARSESESSDDTIRHFLLGRLDANQQSAFEERLFADSELVARVRLAEFDLSDDYAYHRLGVAERQLFRQKFLVTTERNKKLAVSMALRNRYAKASDSYQEVSSLLPLRSFFNLRQPAWKYAFGAGLLIVLLTTAWVVTRNPQLANRFIPRRAVSKPSITPTPQAAHHATSSSPPVHREQPRAMPGHELPTLTVVLAPAERVDQSTLVTLSPAESDVVRFELSGVPELGAYRAQLQTVAGDQILNIESVEAFDSNGRKIFIDVSGRLLKRGQHRIVLSRLNGESTGTGLTIYYFQVQ